MSRNYKSQFMRLCFVLPMVFLGACGDDDAEPNLADDVIIKSGFFRDSAVSGLSYSTATQSGITNSNGEFNYIEGESVTLRMGDIVFPTAIAQFILTPVELVGNGAGSSNITALNIARLLQTLDSNDDPTDGITIGDDVIDAATTPIDFTSTDFEANAQLFIDTLQREVGGEPLTLISAVDAQSHLDDTINAIEVSKFSNEFLSGNTFKVVHDDEEVAELYFNTYVADQVNTGTYKNSSGFIYEITQWQVTDVDGHLTFSVSDQIDHTGWEFIDPTANGVAATYTYQRPGLANDIPGEGTMTLIEHAFTPNFILGVSEQGNIFDVEHAGQNLTKISFLETQNEEGEAVPYTGTIKNGSDFNSFTWTIDLGILTVTEILEGSDTSEWTFTGTSIEDGVAIYSYIQEGSTDGEPFGSSGNHGQFTLNENVFSQALVLGATPSDNVFTLDQSNSVLSQLSFADVLDDSDEVKPATGTLIREGDTHEFTWLIELGELSIIEYVDNEELAQWSLVVDDILEDGTIEYIFTETTKLDGSTESGTGTMTLVAD